LGGIKWFAFFGCLGKIPELTDGLSHASSCPEDEKEHDEQEQTREKQKTVVGLKLLVQLAVVWS
jgi:hypothetical protein